MKTLTVLSPPYKCIACDTVKRKLDNEGIEYTAAPIEEHPDVLAEAKSAGMLSFPVVLVHEGDQRVDMFAGPSQCSDKLKELKRERAAA